MDKTGTRVVSDLLCQCHELSLQMNSVCAGQSSDSERACDQWQCAAVTLQVNLSFSFVSRVSTHLIECIVVSAIALFEFANEFSLCWPIIGLGMRM